MVLLPEMATPCADALHDPAPVAELQGRDTCRMRAYMGVGDGEQCCTALLVGPCGQSAVALDEAV
jgi:hypothetical protein